MELSAEDVKTAEVGQWRGLHLLHYDLSSCSQKVRILMGELGLTFVSHPVDLRRGAQRSEWFLGINPRGLVPVLVHDGQVHVESNDIIRYLDERFAPAGASLLPATSREQSQMDRWLQLEDELHADLRTVTFRYLAPSPPGADEPRVTTLPDLGYIGRFHDAFGELDDAIGERGHLVGDRLTLADVAWFITLHRLRLAGYPLSSHPSLAGYFRRLGQRPAFARQLRSGSPLLRVAGFAYRHLRRVRRGSLRRDFDRWQAGRPMDAQG